MYCTQPFMKTFNTFVRLFCRFDHKVYLQYCINKVSDIDFTSYLSSMTCPHEHSPTARLFVDVGIFMIFQQGSGIGIFGELPSSMSRRRALISFENSLAVSIRLFYHRGEEHFFLPLRAAFSIDR